MPMLLRKTFATNSLKLLPIAGAGVIVVVVVEVVVVVVVVVLVVVFGMKAEMAVVTGICTQRDLVAAKCLQT